MKKSIGFKIKNPEKKCTDPKCPFHGKISVKGRRFTGTVISDKMHKSVTVMWEFRRIVKKFERYEIKRSKIKAHNPPCINAKLGDKVTIQETRPLSKTKNFVVVQII